MKKLMTICLLAVTNVLALSAQSIYDFRVKDDVGREVSLSDYKGKVLLIVNTATRCGFTPQYKELEALYEKYRGNGLEILDFPCNQFGAQAPGTIREIHEFCTANFDIQFPQFDKIDVNGPEAHPLYTFLKAQKGFGGFDVNDPRGKMMDDMLRKRDADFDKKADIKWNFTKFLVSRDGRIVKRYEPTDKMSDVEADIKREANPVLNTILSSTSISKFTGQPVSEADTETLLRAAMAAHTIGEQQACHYVVITDKAKLKELSGSLNPVVEQCARAIAVCGNTDKPMKGKVQSCWIQDCSAATENILLAAQALGLGAAKTNVYPLNERVAAVSKALKLPKNMVPLCVIAIGHPDENPITQDKWEPEKVSFELYYSK